MANLEKTRSLNVAQKVKTTWAIKGDKNFAFFHALFKKRRRQFLIRGVSIDEEWVSNPINVKKTFFYFYAAKFQPFQGISMECRSHTFKSLSSVLTVSIESPFSFDEIKNDVWDCGVNQARGPDSFCYWFFRH